MAKSQELNSAIVLIVGLSLFLLAGGWILHRLTDFYRLVYLGLGDFGIDHSNLQHNIRGMALWMLKTLSPFFIAIPLAAVISSYLQFGWIWTTKTLKPRLSKLNPVKGFKRLLFNQKTFFKLIINIAKLAAIATVAYLVVRGEYEKFVPLMDTDVEAIFAFLMATLFKVLIYTVALLLIIGILDFAYQKYKHTEDLKMSKQEKKDERKMAEGDPKVKAQQRQMQFQIAFNTMIKELPKADVIVTNPTHVAIALKYDPSSMEAPKVIGKGLRKLAQRIKRIAAEHDIPIVENPPLARALYKHCEIGDEIPGQFYQDVAEIIAQIYQLKGEEA